MKRILIALIFILFFCSLKSARKTWLALGDSITYLNDHPNETYLRVQKGYLSRVVAQKPHINYINKGYNGWTAVRIAEKIEELELSKADYYSVFLGTNDWWAGKTLGSMEDYKQNTGTGTISGAFRIIADKIKQLNPSAMVVLLTPMQRVDFVYVANFKNYAHGSYKTKNDQELEQIANGIKEIADLESWECVDLFHHKKLKMKNLVHFMYLKNEATSSYQELKYPDFLNHNFNPEEDEYPYPLKAIHMTYDGLHPSDQGNEVIANELIKVFEKFEKAKIR